MPTKTIVSTCLVGLQLRGDWSVFVGWGLSRSYLVKLR